MKSNKIYGYAELTGYTVPDITKLQSNYYPFATYETVTYKRNLTGEATVNSIESEAKIAPQEYHVYRHLRSNINLSSSYRTSIVKESLSITLGEISSGSDNTATFNSKLFTHSNAFRFNNFVIPSPPATVGICEVYTQYATDEVNYGKAELVSLPRSNKVLRPWRRFNLNDSVNMTVDATFSRVTNSTIVDNTIYFSGRPTYTNFVHNESKYVPAQNHSDEYGLNVNAPIVVLTNEILISLEDEVTVRYPTLSARGHVANVSSATPSANVNVQLSFEMKYHAIAEGGLQVTEQLTSTIIDPDKDLQSGISPETLTSRIELI